MQEVSASQPYGKIAKIDLVHDRVMKSPWKRSDDVAGNATSVVRCRNEINVWRILEGHERLAKCFKLDPENNCIELEYYPHGTLQNFVFSSSRKEVTKNNLRGWARQMIQGVEYIHSKGVIHADLRLGQWLVDRRLDVRLFDFEASEYAAQPHLGLPRQDSMTYGGQYHRLPLELGRRPDTTKKTDLFALGSTLYEMVESIDTYGPGDRWVKFEEDARVQKFPETDGLMLGPVIRGCWHGTFASAQKIMDLHSGVFVSVEPEELAWPANGR